MKVTTQRLPESQVVLEIDVDEDRVKQSLDQAYRRLAPRTRVPGFRPGKAPRAMIERYLGQGALLREALDHLVPEVYYEAIEQEGIEPVDQPDYEITSVEPVSFKATVPVRPTVELGDYSSLSIERSPIEVTDEKVEENLEELRKRYAHLESVDRPVQAGDTLLADIVGTSEDGEEFVRQEEVEFKVEPDVPTAIPGLIESIVGVAPGETREFDLDVPEEFQDERLAGKKAHYSITAHEVKEEKLPDLNDEFAQRVGEGFATLSLLREQVRKDLQGHEEEAAHRLDQEHALDKLTEQAQLEFPAIMVEREIDQAMQQQSGPVTSAQDLERRLKRVGMSEEEIREQVRVEAEEKVRRSLVLTAFAELEKIEVTPEDIEAEIDRMSDGTTEEQAQQIKMIFGTDNGREVIRRSLYTRKALDRLVEIAAPAEPAAEEAPATPARKGPRRAPRSAETEGSAEEVTETVAESATES